ncbi:MAG: septum formation initiator family protein [Evtepia sp.]|uniref:septum formation initiator family protein n=1 Tax=Evtepia sp. TaxID=2773933 RepID=UPI002986BEF6|nr:septum formation initiator family protein [Evtepia sp.]MDD5863706.1 septum formation initiator family protein [Bacillota bacterium]MDD7289166.1 septum formation initiator family protein [Clostridiales bacterium]MDY3992574.1 septum formation initiator family protein [Evtepia sp.]MDY4430951.1 septum formation initiator family protein [Evtepia sp.]
MFPKKRAGLLGKILLIVVLAYMIFLLIGVRQKIAIAKAEVETLTEQVAQQTQSNTELSNAIENRDNPNFLEDIAREKLDLASPHDRVFYITD